MMSEEQDPTTPGYKSRKMLAEELAQEQAKYAALLARIEALEAKPQDTVKALADALKEDRETAASARLQRELAEARAQIEDLKRPQTPTSGVRYEGLVQATQDCWDLNGYHFGPKEGRPGDVFHVAMEDYWPGCPFVPVIQKHAPDGSVFYSPHPDFQSH
jgi:hypothetical protein